jgi:hypothetical protein
MNPRNELPEEPLIARDATYHRAPEGLRDRVRRSLAQEGRAHGRKNEWWRWGGIAASLMVASLLTWNGVMMTARGAGPTGSWPRFPPPTSVRSWRKATSMTWSQATGMP